MFNPPNYYQKKYITGPKKYTTEEKEKLNRMYNYGISYDQIKKISEKLVKKVYAHGDSSESTKEFVREHPEYHSLPSWKEKKKMLKKRFPYLTSKEIDFLGIISNDFEGRF